MSENTDHVVTPAMVRAAHTVTRMNERANLDQRAMKARANGYRGPLTRKDLAAMALRAERDNA